jgi:hypothetical protein
VNVRDSEDTEQGMITIVGEEEVELSRKVFDGQTAIVLRYLVLLRQPTSREVGISIDF